jgi:hypothetical protein
MPDKRRARLYKQQSRQPCGPAALPFPIRAVFETGSEGHRWVFEPGVSHHVEPLPRESHSARTPPVRPRKHTTSPAHFLWLNGGAARELTAAQTPVRYDAKSTAIPISATRANGISVDQGISCPLVGL